MLRPTENNEAVIIDPGSLTFVKAGEVVVLTGPMFSMESFDCDDGIFIVNSKNILAIRK